MICKISPTLRQEITAAKSEWKLARMLEENNIMKIGVHPLYPDNPNLTSARNMGIASSRGYVDYKQSLSGFFASMDGQDDTLLLLEDMLHAPKIISHYFAMNEIIRTPGLKVAYTPTGRLPEIEDEPGWPSAREYGKANADAGNPEAIIEMMKKADGMFFFGMYLDACIMVAKYSMVTMWAKSHMEINTYTNQMVSKSTSDFWC